MPSWIGTRSFGLAIAIAVVVTFLVLASNGAFVREEWTRENPLVHSIPVVRIQGGAIELSDGRTFRPAGVARLDSASSAEYDHALGVMGAQGVVIVRDLGDGRAFLLVEPKFYNWCGTRSMFHHWAGGYFQCGLSELLVHAGYARVEEMESGISPQERWRLESVVHVAGIEDAPKRISTDGKSLRYTAAIHSLQYTDDDIASLWKPAPNR